VTPGLAALPASFTNSALFAQTFSFEQVVFRQQAEALSVCRVLL
jgi:hypothetical protein